MSEEAAFIKAIKKNPKDRTARLVFADWLQEHDDPRAAWIRDDEIWEWMKPDAKNPTAKLIDSIRRRYRYRQAYRALGKLGPTVVPAILAALREDERGANLLNYALRDIAPHSEPALPQLLDAAKDKNPRVRTGAIYCLGGLVETNAEAREAVVAACDDRHDDVSYIAYHICRENITQPVVRDRLQDAVPHLYDIVRDPNAPRRGSALDLLHRLNVLDESLIPFAVSMLEKDLDTAAGCALMELGAPAARAVLTAASGWNEDRFRSAAWVLERTGAPAIAPLREALNGSDTATRRLAAIVLPKLTAEQPATDAVSGLIEALRSGVPAQEQGALEALQRLGPAGAGALPTLVEWIEKATDDWRIGQIGLALFALGPAAQAAVPALLNYTERASGGSWRAASLLDGLGHGASALIVALARDDTGGLYLPISDTELGEVRNELRNALRNETTRAALRKVAKPARQFPPAKAVRAILPFLSDEALATRLVAIFALRHVATPDAVAGIVAALKDKDRHVRLCAVRALVRTGKNVDGVVEALRALKKDRAKDVREAVTKALKEL